MVINRGVYSLECTTTRKKYFGASTNLPMRKASHFFQLRKNKHPNDNMQNDFNKYGESAFRFKVIHSLPKSSWTRLRNIELSLIVSSHKDNIYNIAMPNLFRKMSKNFDREKEPDKKKNSKWRDLTWKQFADMAGISRQTVYNVLYKGYTPSWRTAEKIEKATKGEFTHKDFFNKYCKESALKDART